MSLWEELTTPQTEELYNSGVRSWQDAGVTILRDFIPHDLIDAYTAERYTLLPSKDKWRAGFASPTCYMHVESMRKIALYEPLMRVLAVRIGRNDPGLHLCLTGFQSTERAWHQDIYLNPEGVGQNYIAVWIALDDIHPDSGPFEYIPGSHLWQTLTRQKVLDYQVKRKGAFHNDNWPWETEGFVGEACEEEIKLSRVEPVVYVPKKGDVLLWHAYLIHRGSYPKNRELERPALICHYSSINHRPDMPSPVKENGGYYFPFEGVLK